MTVNFNVGSKCAVMLPREFINPQLTPAKALIVNKLVDSRSLILVEEVWQFKGLNIAPLQEMCTSVGTIKTESWGWKELPQLLPKGEYLMLPASHENIMQASSSTLEELIKRSVRDFKELNGFL